MTPKKPILQKNWITKKMSEVCFGMIFSYFAIDIMDIYGPKGML
jgi:hypothetical protein